MSLPAQLTNEQRDQLARATAQLATAIQAYTEALLPAMQAASAQFRQLFETFRAAGLLDEHGQPRHQGGNAEDCPACSRTNLPYPVICPGPTAG
jgi:hypothetical protein